MRDGVNDVVNELNNWVKQQELQFDDALKILEMFIIFLDHAKSALGE